MCGVPIVSVMRRKLEIPAQLAGVRIESNERAGVEIVAGANVAIPIRTGIADTPIDEL